jgi:erythritol kinase
MAARDCYAAMGGAPPEIRLTGGAARSDGLRRILADVLGVPVRPALRQEAGAAGAAMIAAVATGVHADMETAITEWVSPLLGAPDRPAPVRAAAFSHRFEIYRAARKALSPTWAALAATETQNER